jgi:hypothetical protein
MKLATYPAAGLASLESMSPAPPLAVNLDDLRRLWAELTPAALRARLAELDGERRLLLMMLRSRLAVERALCEGEPPAPGAISGGLSAASMSAAPGAGRSPTTTAEVRL